MGTFEREFCFVFWFCCAIVTVTSRMKFTNVVCEVNDPDWLIVKRCDITFLSRKVDVVNVNVQLKRKTFNTIIQYGILKRSNGWHPFLFSARLDCCAFFLDKNKYPFARIAYEIGRNYTNVNHTCPYEAGDELILKSMPVREDAILGVMPLDVGEYMLYSKFYSDNKLRISINGSIAYTDYKKDNRKPF